LAWRESFHHEGASAAKPQPKGKNRIHLQRHRVHRDYFSLSPLDILRGHEKKFKNDQNRKNGLNEIKHLQLLILAKTDFFSRPAPPR